MHFFHLFMVDIYILKWVYTRVVRRDSEEGIFLNIFPSTFNISWSWFILTFIIQIAFIFFLYDANVVVVRMCTMHNQELDVDNLFIFLFLSHLLCELCVLSIFDWEKNFLIDFRAFISSFFLWYSCHWHNSNSLNGEGAKPTKKKNFVVVVVVSCKEKKKFSSPPA